MLEVQEVDRTSPLIRRTTVGIGRAHQWPTFKGIQPCGQKNDDWSTGKCVGTSDVPVDGSWLRDDRYGTTKAAEISGQAIC